LPSLSEPRTHNWRQGRFASESVAERIKATNLALTRAVGSGDIFVIASQDCDICCDSYEEEPMFEVVLARYLPDDDSEDGNFSFGKNPRRLQMRIERLGTEFLYELNINERLAVPRSFLAEAQDGPSGSLSARDLEVFRRWLGRRYYRSALPTEFNERCRTAQNFAAEKLKKRGKLITCIYLQLDPRYEELDESQEYRVFVHLTVLPETALSPELLEQALEAQSTFEKAFARCDGINLLGVQVISEAEFSLRDVRECVRWDHADYISYKAGPAKNIVPEGDV
jgi:hypothetical protein